MNSRVSWSVDGIDPSVRERAEAAARRAGMSLNDWLNSTLGDTAPPNFRGPYDQRPHPMPQAPSQESREVADIHQRLDAITQQIERISKPVQRQDAARQDVSREQGVARQLNDAISRLDARLSQISKPQQSHQQPHQAPRPAPAPSPVETRQRQADAVERAAAQVYRSSPPLSPASFDVAVAEITARQSELDGFAPRQMPPRAAPPIAPAPAPFAPPMAPPAPAYAPPPPQPPGPDFSSLERHLLKITSQIESLQRPDNTEQAIAAFRSELAEIRAAITEAMPRRAIESIENEIRSLHRRIDETRSNGTDGQVLSGIERALSDIKQVLRTLTPAEQLTGYDEAIRNLGAKLDLILRANDDPSTVQQLEGAISALRAIVSNVASNEALARLSEDVQLLSSKVDQITRASGHSDSFAVLEQRIAALTAALETRERPQPAESTEHLEAAIRALSDRFDRMQVGNDSASTFAHLEQRVSYLLERIEAASDPRNGNLSRVEDGLHDILRHLERQQATYSALAESRSSAPPDSGMVDLVKRELSDIRFSQAETNRSTQDSLDAVHSALGHVVDRLSMIEGDLRAVRSAPPAPAPMPMAMPMAAPMEPAPMAREPRPQAQPQQQPKYDPKPELPNPAAAQAAQAAFVAAPRDFHAAAPAAPPPMPPAPQAAPPLPPRAISEILEPHTAPARAALAPELPPDHPLEPGTRPGGRAATPSERIAASESAISDIPAAPKEPVSSSSFIAAARRAAQAAAAAPPEKAGRAAKASAKAGKDKGQEGGSTITSKIRSLLVGASVVVIVLGTFKMAMNLLDGGSAPAPQAMQNVPSEPVAPAPPPPVETKPATPEQITPSMTSPTPIGRQSQNNAAPAPATNPGSSASVEIPPAPAAAAPPASSDVTGALSGTSRGKLGLIQVPPSEKLPDGIGGPALRTAAMKGDATAAYEIGMRFAEGKGVATNYDEAAKWYDRAAQAGVIPATFRLGTLYEKGLGVKKDADIARRYYTQAAERGNAKAMHNLAVLDADGGGRGANYKSAAQWFRKAADRGVADSQFNLGILYARGIGVEQNLAESYKWFSLAAAQGDTDASGKRDDVAKRLDPQSLAAAKLAIQTFSAEPQPDDAVNVVTPAGGWDSAPQAAAKPAAKAVAAKRSASAAH
jgi:localization factor PodJL